jgi:hypothetical protein
VGIGHQTSASQLMKNPDFTHRPGDRGFECEREFARFDALDREIVNLGDCSGSRLRAQGRLNWANPPLDHSISGKRNAVKVALNRAATEGVDIGRRT